jgi:hypothetical protein
MGRRPLHPFVYFMRYCEKHLIARRKTTQYGSGDKHPLFGKHIPEVTRKKMSLAKKGKPFSEEHKKNLKISAKKAWTPERRARHILRRTGEKRSDETRQKMREKALQRWAGKKKVNRREKAGKSWKDPEYRKKWREGIMKAIEGGEGVRKMWEDDPEYAKKWVRGMVLAIESSLHDDGVNAG